MTMKIIIINDDADETRALGIYENEEASASKTVIYAGKHREFTIWKGKKITLNEIINVKEVK
jgi:hypothetical protein